MKKIVLIITALLMLQPVFGSVIISEVLYNPLNTENGGEAIVLYNNGNELVDVSGWFIATKTSSKDATLPQNTSILPGRNLLIADSGFSLDKDDASWPDPHHEESLTMSNSDSGVALMKENTVMDAVGWGDPNLIDQNLFERIPHQGSENGESLRRINYQDSDDNSVDFISTVPVFFREYNPLEIIIDVEVNITNKNPVIKRLEILTDDNSSKSGIQIKPYPGLNRSFEVLVEVFDDDEIDTVEIDFDNKRFELEKTSENITGSIFKGNITMKYYDEADNYDLTAIVNEDFSKTISFEYESLTQISSEEKLVFQMVSGSTSEKQIVVRNLGNEDVLLKIKGTEIVNGVGSMPVESVEYSINNFTSTNSLSKTFSEIKTLEKGTELEIGLKMTTGEGLKSGNYNGEIIIKAYE